MASAATARTQPADEPSDGDGSEIHEDGAGSRASGSFEEGAESEVGSEEAQAMGERERLVHWWCRKQLSRCLKKLRGFPEAGPFLEPLPWKELGLDDYLEVVENPMDLKTIGDNLERGGYEDDDGLIDPDVFWEDVMLVWENCSLYYEGDETAEPYQMAQEMKTDAEELEEEFWAELERFESSIENISGNMAVVGTVADVAASHVEDKMRDAAALADDLTRGMVNWWRGPEQDDDDRSLPESGEWDLGHQGRAILKAEAPVGKGRITIIFKDSVPLRKDDRLTLENDLVAKAIHLMEINMDELEIDWERVWREPDHLKSHDAARTSDKDVNWSKLEINYRVNLNVEGHEVLHELEQVVSNFDVAIAMPTFKKVLGNSVKEVLVEPMTVSKTSRRPLRDHYLDVILETSRLNNPDLEGRVMQDLQEIEDELQEALRGLLPVIKEIDAEDDRNTQVQFPEAHKKVPLHQLAGPKFNAPPGDTKKAAKSKDAKRNSLSRPSSRASFKSDRSNPEPGELDKPRSEASSDKSKGRHGRSSLKKEEGPATKKEEGPATATAGRRLSGNGKDMLQTLMASDSEDDDDDVDSPKEVAPDVDKLKNIYRTRDKNAGERQGKDGEAKEKSKTAKQDK